MAVHVRRDWDPEDVFAGVNSSRIPKSLKQIQARRSKLWKDLYTEYDARHLEREIRYRGLLKTPEAEVFLSAWAADERRHTCGFVRIMELVADVKPADLWKALAERKHDFAAVAPCLADEFSILVTIAFDEMVTCHAYKEDRGFYATLGDDRFLIWLRELMADEAIHCRNAIKVIRKRHAGRRYEAEAILERLTCGVISPSDYGGTFVLDYFGDHHTQAILDRCKASVLRAIVSIASPTPPSLDRSANNVNKRGAP